MRSARLSNAPLVPSEPLTNEAKSFHAPNAPSPPPARGGGGEATPRGTGAWRRVAGAKREGGRVRRSMGKNVCRGVRRISLSLSLLTASSRLHTHSLDATMRALRVLTPRAAPPPTNRPTPLRRPAATPDPPPDDPLTSVASDLLASSPDAQAALARVGDAAARVAELQAQSAALERELAAAAASDDGAAAARVRATEAIVTQREAEYEVAAARAAVASAEAAASAADAAAATQRRGSADRSESAKAAAVAGGAAALAAAPVALATGGGVLSSLLSVIAAGATGVLLGVTYRYAVRADDGDNAQLRAGVVAAFGLVRAIGGADALQAAAGARGEAALTLDIVARAALGAGEAMLVAAFAGAALEAAIRGGGVKRWGERD